MKPRIFFRDGWWRVSKIPKPFWKHRVLWDAAHRYTAQLNQTRCVA
jgi:hypothetical protein